LGCSTALNWKSFVIIIDINNIMSEFKYNIDLDLNKPLRDLSTGARSVVRLFRSFISSPKLILLDEPASNLDYENRNIFWDEFGRYIDNKELDLSIVLVSHNATDHKRIKEIGLNSGFKNLTMRIDKNGHAYRMVKVE